MIRFYLLKIKERRVQYTKRISFSSNAMPSCAKK